MTIRPTALKNVDWPHGLEKMLIWPTALKLLFLAPWPLKWIIWQNVSNLDFSDVRQRYFDVLLEVLVRLVVMHYLWYLYPYRFSLCIRNIAPWFLE